GLVAALNTYADMRGLEPMVLPATTAFGSLLVYATDPKTNPYQPMHVNYGLVPSLAEQVRGKRERYAAYSSRARMDLAHWLSSRPDLFGSPTACG
ncbi:MAG: methylenetetrahydrofolate--tRNA-(uracil(54)-C(5))-methyltransferase (FADH(2)-oxidizing) TrmFO, partial [Actinomycetota bacterium]|nr:methylenetetrahydrofolate--tRNA-(uracil(54)-C(5))-methyltransferase (FADH(2)-oxidizing) TrmFO [Actinomycetota bacterium]